MFIGQTTNVTHGDNFSVLEVRILLLLPHLCHDLSQPLKGLRQGCPWPIGGDCEDAGLC